MFFYASKILWMVAQPSNFLPLLLVGATVALLAGWRRLGLWVLTPAVALLVVVGVLPVGQWLALPLEERFPRIDELRGRRDRRARGRHLDRRRRCLGRRGAQ